MLDRYGDHGCDEDRVAEVVKAIAGQGLGEKCRGNGDRGDRRHGKHQPGGYQKKLGARHFQRGSELGGEEDHGGKHTALDHCFDGGVHLYGKIKIDVNGKQDAGGYGGKA